MENFADWALLFQGMFAFWLMYLGIRYLVRRAIRQADIRRGIRAADRERRKQAEREAKLLEQRDKDRK